MSAQQRNDDEDNHGNQDREAYKGQNLNVFALLVPIIRKFRLARQDSYLLAIRYFRPGEAGEKGILCDGLGMVQNTCLWALDTRILRGVERSHMPSQRNKSRSPSTTTASTHETIAYLINNRLAKSMKEQYLSLVSSSPRVRL
jgi:hypothetical protein